MKLRFTPRAVQDIEIAGHIRAENPAAAERVRASILESLENLVLFPRIAAAAKPRKYPQSGDTKIPLHRLLHS
jgi:plasmid stabilization system protein ParE